MFITMCVIAYNEENAIDRILGDIAAQDYNHNDMEVVLVDGASTDNTKNILIISRKNTKMISEELWCLIILREHYRRWNVALEEYKGDAIIKVDAHAEIPKDFVSKNVRVLESGEDICGGQRPVIIDEETRGRIRCFAESSMFGSSIAPYRNNPGKTYVKSMFHAAYRRQVLIRSVFNENLARTEDNEIHYRMRKQDLNFALTPILSHISI